MKSEYLLEVKEVSKFFHGLAGAKHPVLENINFKLEKKTDGGILASIISPINSGKTTLMKIISAIEKPSAGEVYLNGEIYSKPDGTIAYIPEKPSSFPWMNVKQNIEFAMSVSKCPGKKDKTNIDGIISSVGLTGYEDHYPHEKSTGFRIRISLARVLAAGAKLILLDDFFNDLHGETRNEIINLIKSLSKDFNLALLLSSSNVNDAVSISDKIFLLSRRPGRIIKEADIDCIKRKEQPQYISSIKNEIDKCFQEHDKISTLAE